MPWCASAIFRGRRPASACICSWTTCCRSRWSQSSSWWRSSARWCWRRGKPKRMIPLSYYLILSAILFGLGVAGFLFKRNIVTIFMSVELMLNAVNLSFVALSYAFRQLDGQIFVFFVMVVAAAEAAVGLAIIIAVFRNRESLNVDEISLLKL